MAGTSVAPSSPRLESLHAAAGLGGIAVVTAILRLLLHVTNSTTVALSLLVVVLLTAATSRLWTAVVVSVAAMISINFFFLPPVGTLTIADPENWVALFTFLAVSLVASHLSSVARARAAEATTRRDEMARLFDLGRDVLLLTDTAQAFASLARSVARRFQLEYAVIGLPRGDEWDLYEAGTLPAGIDAGALTSAYRGIDGLLEFDARERTYAGHRLIQVGGRDVRVVPLRLGNKTVGVLAAVGLHVEPGTLDAVAGVVAIAIERVHFLQERALAELARQREELKSALLASLGHDLRTPLTAIRVAGSNLTAGWLTEEERREQAGIVLSEAEHLTRLFQNILEMARIEAGAIASEPRWTHPLEIIEAARAQVAHTLGARPIDVEVRRPVAVRVDPQLTAGALAHLIENAAQYSPDAAPIAIAADVTHEGLVLTVRDHGPGISTADLPQLFERFYRGADAKGRVAGTGMGLAIARGLLAAERGRIWAENCADGGARFTIVVPAESRDVPAVAETAP